MTEMLCCIPYPSHWLKASSFRIQLRWGEPSYHPMISTISLMTVTIMTLSKPPTIISPLPLPPTNQPDRLGCFLKTSRDDPRENTWHHFQFIFDHTKTKPFSLLVTRGRYESDRRCPLPVQLFGQMLAVHGGWSFVFCCCFDFVA